MCMDHCPYTHGDARPLATLSGTRGRHPPNVHGLLACICLAASGLSAHPACTAFDIAPPHPTPLHAHTRASSAPRPSSSPPGTHTHRLPTSSDVHKVLHALVVIPTLLDTCAHAHAHTSSTHRTRARTRVSLTLVLTFLACTHVRGRTPHTFSRTLVWPGAMSIGAGSATEKLAERAGETA